MATTELNKLIDNAVANGMTRHQVMAAFRSSRESKYSEDDAREIFVTILEDRFSINAALLSNLLDDYEVQGIDIDGENKDYLPPYANAEDEDQLFQEHYDVLDEHTSRQHLMAFMRADFKYGRGRLTELDRLWIFNTVLRGSDDFSVARLQYLLDEYKVEGITVSQRGIFI